MSAEVNDTPPPTRHEDSHRVRTMTLDGKTHWVARREPHQIAVQTLRRDGSGEVDVEQRTATRFKTGCGLGFDALHDPHPNGKHDHVGSDDPDAAGRWRQGGPVDCAACLEAMESAPAS